MIRLVGCTPPCKYESSSGPPRWYFECESSRPILQAEPCAKGTGTVCCSVLQRVAVCCTWSHSNDTALYTLTRTHTNIHTHAHTHHTHTNTLCVTGLIKMCDVNHSDAWQRLTLPLTEISGAWKSHPHGDKSRVTYMYGWATSHVTWVLSRTKARGSKRILMSHARICHVTYKNKSPVMSHEPCYEPRFQDKYL